jgi:hypothetical protein
VELFLTITKLLVVCAVLYSANSLGAIYKCTDVKGHVIYTDTVCSTKAGHQAFEMLPKQEASHPSFFSAPTQKIKGFIKSISNDRATNSELPAKAPLVKQQTYHCDGRTYCSQMTSCAEATFFINNCPNTKMDGDSNSVPCESQWC